MLKSIKNGVVVSVVLDTRTINKDIQEEISKEFIRILKNVEYLTNKETFSFDRLNTRLGKNIGGTINAMLEAKIQERKKESTY